jgi:hypothetical protein
LLDCLNNKGAPRYDPGAAGPTTKPNDSAIGLTFWDQSRFTRDAMEGMP